MMTKTRLFAVLGAVLALALIAAACSDDGDSSESSGTSAPVDEPDPTDDTGDEGDTDGDVGFQTLEPSSVTAPLDEPYAIAMFEPGILRVSWFATEGEDTYAFVFSGSDPAGPGLPLCPGSSLQTDATTYEFITNGPVDPGACDTFPTDTAPRDPRLCSGILVAFSAIPLDGEGTLKGSLETQGDGSIDGLSSSATANGGDVPDLDPEAAGYVFEGQEFACS